MITILVLTLISDSLVNIFNVNFQIASCSKLLTAVLTSKLHTIMNPLDVSLEVPSKLRTVLTPITFEGEGD